jgi:hypothetical protein
LAEGLWASPSPHLHKKEIKEIAFVEQYPSKVNIKKYSFFKHGPGWGP